MRFKSTERRPRFERRVSNTRRGIHAAWFEMTANLNAQVEHCIVDSRGLKK
jgi:hypothetical protein